MSFRRFIFLFFALFLLRLIFGLCEARWWEKDELQTYLIGLKCYTTGTWPYFGPDVNGVENQSFNSQIPGALEGLVIGLPFYILPIPESPYIFLSLMSTLGAALLARYICRKIPKLSFPWLFVWISITPWSLYEATHVINPAYNFLPSILFFIGFMETLPPFTTHWLSPIWSNALMGFSLFWVMQFHFSYVYFLPLAAFSLLFQLVTTLQKNHLTATTPRPPRMKRHFGWTIHDFLKIFILIRSWPTPFAAERRVWRRGGKSFFYFFLGTAPMLALIIPTFIKYGLTRTNVVSGFTVPFNWYNVSEWVTILARYFSLVCFELPRFIGENNQHRIDFLAGHPFLTIPGGLLWIWGILQVFALLVFWFKGPHLLPKGKLFNWLAYLILWTGIYFVIELPFYQVVILGVVFWFLGRVPVLDVFISWLKKPHPLKSWKELNLLVLMVYLMVWMSFWFTSKLPIAHIYLVFYPLIMIYSCYCWSLFADNPKWRMAAKVFLVLGIYFQLGFAFVVAEKNSLYLHREPLARAIQEKNYHLAGERRPESLY